MLNGVEIYEEIKTAVQDYESQDFNDFGFQIGEALAKLILWETLSIDKSLFLKWNYQINSIIFYVLTFGV